MYRLRRRALPVLSRTRTDSHHHNHRRVTFGSPDPKPRLGLFARVAFKKGQFIVRYSGRKIRSEAADERETRDQDQGENIKPSDEITYHYGRDYFDSFIKAVGCKCMACRKKRAEIPRIEEASGQAYR